MNGRKRGPLSRLMRLVWMALTAAALYKEFQKPAGERDWHGDVAGFVPYDFRIPTIDRARSRLWDPDGDLIGPQVFGVGWAINFGRAWHELQEMTGTEAS